MIWIGYFFLGLLVLFLLLIWIRIKVELKITKQERWIEIRFLMLKYRIDFAADINIKNNLNHQQGWFKGKKGAKITRESMDGRKRFESQQGVQAMTSDPIDTDENKEDLTMNCSESLYVQEEVEDKNKRSWLRAPKAIRVRASKVLKFKFLEQLRVSYYFTQFQRFKGIFKEAKIIFYRLLKRIKIYRLDSLLHFNVDDPMLNAQLMAVLWSLEANFYRSLKKKFRRVKDHQFKIKSEFSGQNLFLETSCIVSFRIVDIIVVILCSLKEIFAIKKMVTLEEEV